MKMHFGDIRRYEHLTGHFHFVKVQIVSIFLQQGIPKYDPK